MSTVQPGFVHRPEQLAFAVAAAESLSAGGVLLADVPTGTGKSLAYLAACVVSRRRAVVTTATIALQTQLLKEDLPILKKAVAIMDGYPVEEGFSFGVMKGRGNFLCAARHEGAMSQPGLLGADIRRKLEGWAASTATGDREEIDFAMPVGQWREVASDGEDCSPRVCPHRTNCHYFAHRDTADDRDILVVNHSLTLANAMALGNIFDTEGRVLVVDEAHRVEEIMSEAFGARVSHARVVYAMRQARKRSVGAVVSADRAEMAADLFFDGLTVATVLGAGEDVAPRGYKGLVNELYAVGEALIHDPSEAANNLASMVGRLLKDLKSFFSPHESTHAYAVVSGGSRKGSGAPRRAELRSWLVDTGDGFREEVLGLFEERGAVLCSATLAAGSGVERSFSYPRGRLGLGEAEAGRRVDEHQGREIFDYQRNCLLYLPTDLPAPVHGGADAHLSACVKRTEELVGLSRGRALVLLSTSRAVSEFRRAFRPGYPVRYQGDDTPARLVRWLKGSEGGVLVGTRGLWEGISVIGPSLSLVVINKIPFAPPDDPVGSALKERAGSDWFRSIALAKASVAMRQGAGRLIRSATDRGVIAVLDPRVSTKNWGGVIRRSLPPAPVTADLRAVEGFFDREDSGAWSGD